MAKTVNLKDGTEVVIRPITMDDVEKSYEFFQSLPVDDRKYLRTDVTQHDLVENRIRTMDVVRTKRLVGLVGEEIVADGALDLEGHGWLEHVAELRLIVSPEYKRRGLGTLMARELFMIAVSEKVEEVIVRMMAPQKAARGIVKRLGFHDEIVLPGYVKDLGGQKQDMILMRCDVEGLWREMEAHVERMDWRPPC
jgi:ribosomal protein S18 acetylase RimI-like enzyme